MVARRNLDPRLSLGQAITSLRESINSVQTRAHGVKVAGPGEGLELVGDDGSAVVIDAAKAAAWDEKTAAASDEVGAARAELDAARALFDMSAEELGAFQFGEAPIDASFADKTLLASTLVARQGYFTEGLTAQDAVLLGETLAENLTVTGEFGARLVTSGMLQTDMAPAKGLKIRSSGMVAYSLTSTEAAPAELFNLDVAAGTLTMSGTYRTSPAGQPGLIMVPRGSSAGGQHMGLWLSTSGTVPGDPEAFYGSIAGIWMDANITPTTAAPLQLRGQNGQGIMVRGTHITIDPVSTQDRAIVESSTGHGLTLRGNTYLDLAGTAVRAFNRSEPFRITGTGDDYPYTTSSGSNVNISENGLIRQVTSSFRFKKYPSTWEFDPRKIPQIRLGRWRDRKQPGLPEDMDWHYGAFAEEVFELYPEIVPTIPDPTWPRLEDGSVDPNAPQLPNSIEYDRLALAVGVAGYRDADARLKAIEAHLGITPPTPQL